MKHFLPLSIVLLFTIQLSAQKLELEEFSYVVVPDKFEFLTSSDQYQLNSMALFYFEKSGFNAYLSNLLPNAERCNGLYADVEELGSILGTKLQVVLRDCNNQEVFRSEVGKSKYKEFDKTYQDALRKAFKSIERLNVNQKDVVLLNNSNSRTLIEERKESTDRVSTKIPNPSNGAVFPTSKFLNYLHNGQSYLLRKTAEGYSLYLETTKAEDGLQLMGKIIEIENLLKYLDTAGKAFDVVFNADGNLVISNFESSTEYQLVD